MARPRVENPLERQLTHPSGIQHFVRHVGSEISDRIRGKKDTQESRPIKIIAIHSGDQKTLSEKEDITRVK